MKTKTKKSILTLEERIKIEFDYHLGKSISEIAKRIKKNRSTVYREINGKPREGKSRYRAHIAHENALKRISNRGNIRKMDKYEKLKKYVEEKLKLE